ncbi:hypothetical protein V1478_018382 [Vespula squamosa]|uniref:Uncharacterized protein n=1 Tax=Vespula squamosa TaxID=30214 RepID=A0ABD1ZVK2_VESSQ
MDAGERYDEVDREEEEEEEEERRGGEGGGGGGWVPPNRVPVMYAPVLSSESASSLYRGNQIARSIIRRVEQNSPMMVVMVLLVMFGASLPLLLVVVMVVVILPQKTFKLSLVIVLEFRVRLLLPPKVTTTEEMLARWNRCDHFNRRRLKPRDDGVDVMRIEDSSSTT